MTLPALQCDACGRPLSRHSAVCGSCGAVVGASERLASPEAPASSREARAPEFDRQQFGALLRADSDGLRRIFEAVASSPHVRVNGQYAQAAKRCGLHFCEDEAYPMGALVAAVGDGSFECRSCSECLEGRFVAVIVMPASFFLLAGLLASYVGAPMLVDRSASRLAVARHRLGECTMLLRPPDFAAGPASRSLLERAERAAREPGILALARDIADGIALAVVAHELGHFAYGHLGGRAASHEINRNAERDADSFAASVLATLPNPDRSLIGAALVWAVAAQRARQSGVDEVEITHPRAHSRLESLMVSMPSAAGVLESVHGLAAADLRQVAG